MFGRRRGGRDRDLDAAADLTAEADAETTGDEFDVGDEPGREGPWDAAEPYPDLQRVDFGSLQVPVLAGTGHPAGLRRAAGRVRDRASRAERAPAEAFAAPKRGSLWDDVRAEIAAEIAARAAERRRSKPVLSAPNCSPRCRPRLASPARACARSGSPAWTARAGSCAGLYSGPAAESPAAAAPLEALMREVVVVRGDQPVPPRDLLELRLPAEAAQALAEEQARAQEEQNRFTQAPNPFERGPEITETR